MVRTVERERVGQPPTRRRCMDRMMNLLGDVLEAQAVEARHRHLRRGGESIMSLLVHLGWLVQLLTTEFTLPKERSKRQGESDYHRREDDNVFTIDSSGTRPAPRFSKPLTERNHDSTLKNWQYKNREGPSPYDDEHYDPRPAILSPESGPHHKKANENVSH